MKYRDRNGNDITGNQKQDLLLRLLYGTAAGRLLISPLARPAVSRLAGALLSTRCSALAARWVVKRRGLDLTDCKETRFSSYNAFFHRELLPHKRPVAPGEDVLISPCDGKLLVCPIEADSRFAIKHSRYSLGSLLRDEGLAARFDGGTLMIFRLTVDDYHRYCYVANGRKTENVRLPGVLHSVNPVAVDHLPVYKENAREYCLLETEAFGTVLVMEVGALLVGRIRNHHGACAVRKGMEKGYFEFGGSTIVLGLERGRAAVDADILANSREGLETLVRLGERVGVAAERTADA